MFKGQPKGLFALALANTGERFGYYTMLAIFVLFIQAKFNLPAAAAGQIYGIFLAAVYFMPFFGGILADKIGYGKCVVTGLAVMFAGYTCLSIPTEANALGMAVMIFSLLLISVGTGLFKGNLQVMVGNLYDDPKYSAKRDSAFSLFYMAINIGAMFAPSAATAICNWHLKKFGYVYNNNLPELANKVMKSNELANVTVSEISADIAAAQAPAAAEIPAVADSAAALTNAADSTAAALQATAEAVEVAAADTLAAVAQTTTEVAAAAADQLPEITKAAHDIVNIINMEKMQFDGTLVDFCKDYLDKLSSAYNFGFAVACVSLIVSALIYFGCRKWFKHADVNAKQAAEKPATAAAPVEELTKEQTKSRIVALCFVFAIVIFFWMAFHQNGLTLTYFAKNYTFDTVTGWERIGFNIWALALIAISVYTIFGIFQSDSVKGKVGNAIATVALLGGAVALYFTMEPTIKILPQEFQQFNPFYVVALTPISMAIFGWLAKRNLEPSAPKKIGIGMFVAACGFLIMTLSSIGLVMPQIVGGGRVNADVLMSTYLVLTFAELLLSPMGISFVSKVAPPKYKGMMMGGWFAATAIGNYLTSIPALLWDKIPLYAIWLVLLGLCVVAGLIMFALMKRIEAATK